MLASARQRQRGQVLVLFCLVLPFLLGAVGLAVDVGFGLAQRQRMQATADLAALNAAYCQVHPTLPMCVSAASFPGAGARQRAWRWRSRLHMATTRQR